MSLEVLSFSEEKRQQFLQSPSGPSSCRSPSEVIATPGQLSPISSHEIVTKDGRNIESFCGSFMSDDLTSRLMLDIFSLCRWAIREGKEPTEKPAGRACKRESQPFYRSQDLATEVSEMGFNGNNLVKKVTQQEAVRSFVELTASSQLALSPVNQQQTPPRHEPALCKIPDLRTTLMQLQAAVHVAVWRNLSETNFGDEEVLHAAINAMHLSNTRKGIEGRLANCEKVLRLILQVSLASFNSSHLEQKEEIRIILN
ncbi:hypothetical protein OS493_020416 [Desmophyllum pertusum]|uniref:Uncharacterized protein n=1 Tax=Desmophyllum pertusum TaxID=174260 RepID=A0A9W9ZDS3_9CNID|nr:hypothetical protein OS493_020416 [Desmophyllum pertusum]